MMVIAVTRDDILRCTRPEGLFPGDLDRAQQVYRDLARQWHPDKPGGDADVTAKLNALYTEAKRRITSGTWEGAARVVLTRKSNSPPLVFAVRRAASMPWGRQLVSDDHVVQVFTKTHATLARTWYQQKFLFGSAAMKEKCAHFVPDGCFTVELDNGQVAVVVPKPAEMLRLRDVRDHAPLDMRHVAWMVSEMCSLACYLEYAGVVHADLSLDTLFVRPKAHTMLLAGGWQHALATGAALRQVPARTHAVMPFKAKRDKQAVSALTLELVRLTGRELAASASTRPPEAMRRWLQDVSVGTAVEMFGSWGRALSDSFGARKFVELSLTADAVYGGR